MKDILRQTDIVSPRFIRFCAVGIANVLVDFLFYSLLLWFAFSPYISRTTAWCVACLFSYSVNRRWTFKAGDKGLMPMARFVVVNLCSLCFGLVLLYVFKKLGCGDRTAFILSLPFTTAMNYLGYRFWTFRHVNSKI